MKCLSERGCESNVLARKVALPEIWIYVMYVTQEMNTAQSMCLFVNYTERGCESNVLARRDNL